MLIVVEPMFPEGIVTVICLMITFAINIFEEIKTKFVFRVCLEIDFITSSYISVILILYSLLYFGYFTS